MSERKVIIGLPVHNGQKYLGAAIESHLSQSFGDFDLVISDNGSTDATPEICARYASQDAGRARDGALRVLIRRERGIQMRDGVAITTGTPGEVCGKGFTGCRPHVVPVESNRPAVDPPAAFADRVLGRVEVRRIADGRGRGGRRWRRPSIRLGGVAPSLQVRRATTMATHSRVTLAFTRRFLQIIRHSFWTLLAFRNSRSIRLPARLGLTEVR